MKERNYGVYFIHCGKKGNTPVKIGVTCDIEERVSSLQTGNPYQLFCKALIPCHDKKQAYELESFLHNRFKKERMIVEWFRLYNFDLKEILNCFSEKQSFPLEHQKLNTIRKTNKESKKLKRENAELKIKILDLEDQIDEFAQITLATDANLYQ